MLCLIFGILEASVQHSGSCSCAFSYMQCSLQEIFLSRQKYLICIVGGVLQQSIMYVHIVLRNFNLAFCMGSKHNIYLNYLVLGGTLATWNLNMLCFLSLASSHSDVLHHTPGSSRSRFSPSSLPILGGGLFSSRLPRGEPSTVP